MGLMDGVNDFGSGQGDVSPTTDLSGIQDYSNGGNYNDAGATTPMGSAPDSSGGDTQSNDSWMQLIGSANSMLASAGLPPAGPVAGDTITQMTQTNQLADNTNNNGGWISKILKTINDPDNKTSVALGAQLVQGFFSAPTLNAQRKYYESSAKSNEVRANAEALTAQTNSDIAKQKMANASGIKQTNFGAPQTGLIYTDLLAQRRARSGVTS